VDAYDWEICQIQYNLLDTRHQAGTEGLLYAAERKLGVIIMEPLRGGFLAGSIPLEVQAVWRRAEVPRSPVQWALRWLWNHPEITVVLSGMNEEAHVAENIQIAAQAEPLAMPAAELALVAKVEQTYRKLMQVGCTGCGYCMPCPAGVNIPNCFEYYNALFMFERKTMTRFKNLGQLYGAMGAPQACASLCQGCGRCEAKCPQQLPIQRLLAEVAATFETFSQKRLAWFMGWFFKFQRLGSIRRAWRTATAARQ